jgi:hypothetical protein
MAPIRASVLRFMLRLSSYFRVLSAYYYGNLSFPSVDPPKIGLLSTVPTDASQQLKAAVTTASKAGNFPGAFFLHRARRGLLMADISLVSTAVSEPAPSGTVTPALTKANTIVSPTANVNTSSGARGLRALGFADAHTWLLILAVLGTPLLLL